MPPHCRCSPSLGGAKRGLTAPHSAFDPEPKEEATKRGKWSDNWVGAERSATKGGSSRKDTVHPGSSLSESEPLMTVADREWLAVEVQGQRWSSLTTSVGFAFGPAHSALRRAKNKAFGVEPRVGGAWGDPTAPCTRNLPPKCVFDLFPSLFSAEKWSIRVAVDVALCFPAVLVIITGSEGSEDPAFILAKIIGFPAQSAERSRGSKRAWPYHVGFPSTATSMPVASTSYPATNELRTVQESAVSEGQRSASPSSFNNCEPDQNNVVETSQYECQADNWCCTQVNVIKFSYLWTINNFSYCHEELGEVLKSSTFGSSHNDKMRWCLRINPKGLDEESKDFLSLYLLLVQSDKSDVRAKFKFSILNADREESKAMESQRAYKFVQSKDWGFKKFIRREYLLNEENGLLPDDRLSIFCEVSIVTDAVNITGHHTQLPQIAIPPSTLSEDYSALFTEGICTDCEIVVEDKVIKAHKAILASRSEVFRAMFTHPTTEKDRNKVFIDDLDAETVRGMLHFIYGDNVPDLDYLAIKLMSAADKYQLKRLKQMCEWSLCNALSTSNVCQILVHADLHCAEQLKGRCIAFINQNSLTIVDTEGWKVLARDYGTLLAQVYKAMATQHMPIAQFTAPPKAKRVRYV